MFSVPKAMFLYEKKCPFSMKTHNFAGKKERKEYNIINKNKTT